MPQIPRWVPNVLSTWAIKVGPFDVIMQKQTAKDEPELQVAQVLANASAWPEREGLARVLVLACVGHTVRLKPALRNKLVRSVEVVGRMCCCPAVA